MRSKVNIKIFDSTPSLPTELGLYSVRQQIIQFHTKPHSQDWHWDIKLYSLSGALLEDKTSFEL